MNSINVLKNNIKEYHLPTYNEIPDVGLYLEQVVKYINTYLSPLTDNLITSSMISNYVKKGIVDNPVKKQYSRKQIATLLYIAICKVSLSLEEIEALKDLGLKSFDEKVAYTYFCKEFEDNLLYVFGLKKEKNKTSDHLGDIQLLLSTTITAVTYQIYLSHMFKSLINKDGEQ